MNALLLSTFLTLAAPAVELNANIKNGDVISGEKSFRVTAYSTKGDPITQVEFFVGGELRDSDTSTPYEFRLDTLSETDGNLVLKFKAYSSTSETGEKTITVKVDNGMDKGAAHHVERGEALAAESKWDEAITAGRIALKIDPNSNAARLLMARAYLGQNVFDKAQKFAEDAVEADPNDLRASDLLSVIHLRRAFRTVNTGGETAETMTLIKDALKDAVEARKKVLDHQVDSMKPSENPLKYADAAIAAGRYSLVVTALKPVFDADQKNAEAANRLAYAHLRLGRTNDALQVMENLKKFGTPDAYSYALMSVIYTELNDEAKGDEAIREAILSDGENLGVQTAQAFIALKRDRRNVLSTLATQLAKDRGDRSEVNYFLSALYSRQNNFQESRRYYQRAVLAEPANYDMYIEKGNESIALAVEGRLDQKQMEHNIETAKVMFETALIARPSSYEALSGLSIIALFQKQNEQALKYAQAAAAAAPNAALSHYALSAALTANRRMEEAQRAMTRAGQLDRRSLEGRQLPDGVAVWRYFVSGGRAPMIAPPTPVAR